MSNRDSTFAGTWRPTRRDGVGHTAEQLSIRSSYDQAPAQGASCLLALVVPLGMAAAIIAAILHTTGAVA